MKNKLTIIVGLCICFNFYLNATPNYKRLHKVLSSYILYIIDLLVTKISKDAKKILLVTSLACLFKHIFSNKYPMAVHYTNF